MSRWLIKVKFVEIYVLELSHSWPVLYVVLALS